MKAESEPGGSGPRVAGVPAGYPAESVGSRMVTSVPFATPDETVAQVLARIADGSGPQWDSLTYTLVLDAEESLVGVVGIEHLNNAPADALLGDIMRTDVVSLPPDADQEEAVRLAICSNLDAIPVADEGAVLGVVDEDALLDIMREEHVEDLLLQSGVRARRHAFDLSTVTNLQQVWRRLPWLVVGLGGGMLATEVMRSFESTLNKRVELAFFIPVMVYMANAVATQTQTIFIRAMALGNVKVRAFLITEQLVSTMLAIALAGVMAGFAHVRFGDPVTTAIVALAMLGSIAAAVSTAVLIPWALGRLGRDPAYGAGPFATVLQDILSISIYFAVATAILSRV